MQDNTSGQYDQGASLPNGREESVTSLSKGCISKMAEMHGEMKINISSRVELAGCNLCYFAKRKRSIS
jgi:hypothetical protein